MTTRRNTTPPVARLAGALGILLLTATPVRAQVAIDSALMAYVQSIQAIDNHGHPMATDPNDRDFDALPIDGFPDFDFPARLRGRNPELVTAWREMFGYGYDDLSEAHLAQVKALKAKTKAEQGNNYPVWVLDRLGLGVMLANRLALGPGLTPPRFRWVAFVDPLLFPLDTKQLETTPDRANLFPKNARNRARYLADLKLKALPPTFQGYLDRVVHPTLERMAAGGAVAVKFEAGYLRRLDFDPATFEDARRVYERYRAGGAPSAATYKPLQDYLFRVIAIEAGRLRMAVHIHSTEGAGGYYDVPGSDPHLLTSAFSDPRLRGTNFVIVHGGGHQWRHTMSLFARPNVYADFSSMGNRMTPYVLGQVLREQLSTFPERILFGTDAYADTDVVDWEEWGWLGATAGRRALAIALTGMLRDGDVTRARAEEIARMVLRDNAAKLYRIE